MYYTENVNIGVYINIDKELKKLYEENLPSYVASFIENTNTKEEFNRVINTLSPDIQEELIKACIQAQVKEIDVRTEFREWILYHFAGYIKNIRTEEGEIWYVFLRHPMKCYSCGSSNSESEETWTVCNAHEMDVYTNYLSEKREKARDIDGIEALWNNQSDLLCLIDHKKVDKTSDKRKINTGKTCGSWTIPELVKIVVDRLKIPGGGNEPLSENRRRNIINTIRGDATLSQWHPNFDPDDDDELKRISHWSFMKSQGGVRTNNDLCTGIKQFFESKGLLHIDNNCGVQGKSKGGSSSTSSTEAKGFTISRIKDRGAFNKVYRKIATVIKNSLGVDSYSFTEDDKSRDWLIISKTSFVGVARYAPEGTNPMMFDLICIKATPVKHIPLIVGNIIRTSGINMAQLVNIDPNFLRIKNNYKSYGFIQEKDTNDSTIFRLV